MIPVLVLKLDSEQHISIVQTLTPTKTDADDQDTFPRVRLWRICIETENELINISCMQINFLHIDFSPMSQHRKVRENSFNAQ